jgi:phage recombination protein Bet
MNDMTRPSTALAIPEDEAIRVLRNSLYPGARPESVALVLAWCRATGRDPMKKPIHIVPMWVRDQVTGQGQMRDVLMPGIGTYRTDAADSGAYAGKSEPDFGPDITMQLSGVEVTFPQWCRITVQRIVRDQVRDFTAKEFWLENYATAGKDRATGQATDAPNAMWRKRPYGQLAKCAESQALRMAFPDETGNTNTAEEMEGKTFEGMTLDARPEPSSAPEVVDRTASAFSRQTPEIEPDKNFVSRAREELLSISDPATWLDMLVMFSEECQTIQDMSELKGIEAVRNAEKNAPKAVKDRIQACWRAAVERLSPRTETPATPPAEPKKRGRPAKAAETPHDPETGEIIPPTGKPPYDEAEQKAASEREMAASAGQTTEVEIWPVDDIGEPLEDQHEPMDAVAFANWFASRLFISKNPDALREHNADNVAEAGAVPEARGVIQGALDRYTRAKTAAPADPPMESVSQKATDNATISNRPIRKPVALPKTPKGAPHWPNYQEACTVEINALVDDDDADDWFKVNLPTFNGRASQIMVENRLNKKRATFVQANNHELFPPTDEMIINDIAVAVAKMTTTDEMRAWAAGPIKAVMAALKARNVEAHVRASAIVDERWIELSPSDGNE